MSYRTSVFNRLGRSRRPPSESPSPERTEDQYYDNQDYYYESHQEYDRTPWPMVNNSTATPSPPPQSSNSISFRTRHYTPENDTTPPPLPPPSRSSKISFTGKKRSRPSPSNLIITANGNDRHVSSSTAYPSSPSSSNQVLTQQQPEQLQSYYPAQPSGSTPPIVDSRPVVWMEDDRGIEIPVLVNSSFYDHTKEPLMSPPIDQQVHYQQSQGDTYIPHYSRLHRHHQTKQLQEQEPHPSSSKKTRKRQDNKNHKISSSTSGSSSKSKSSVTKEQPTIKKIRHSVPTTTIPSTPPTSLSPIGVDRNDPQQQNISQPSPIDNIPPPNATITANVFPVTYQQQSVESMNNYYNQDNESVVSMDTENTNLMLPDWGEDSDNEAKLQAIAFAERRRYEEKEALRQQKELQEESRRFVEEQEMIRRKAEEQEKRQQEELRQARWEAFLRKEQEEEEARRKKEEEEEKERLLREKQQKKEEEERLQREKQKQQEKAQKLLEEQEQKRFEELRKYQEAERKRISEMKQAAIDRERKEQEERALERKRRREEEERRRERERQERETARLKRRRDEEEERRQRREEERKKRETARLKRRRDEEEERKRQEEAERKKKQQETEELLKRHQVAAEKVQKEIDEAKELILLHEQRQLHRKQQEQERQQALAKQLSQVQSGNDLSPNGNPLSQETEERKIRFAEWEKRGEERKQHVQYDETQRQQSHSLQSQQQHQTNDMPIHEENPPVVKQEPVPDATTDGNSEEKSNQDLVQNNNEPLPAPWIPMHPRSAPDETYYYNPETGESTWERPIAVKKNDNNDVPQVPKQQEKNNSNEEHEDNNNNEEVIDIPKAPELSDPEPKQVVEQQRQQQQPVLTEIIFPHKVLTEVTPPLPTNKPTESRDPRIQIMKKLQEDTCLDQKGQYLTATPSSPTTSDHQHNNHHHQQTTTATINKKKDDTNSGHSPSLFMQGKKDTYIPSIHRSHVYPNDILITLIT
ncbi:hypothetical protein BDA99DRAFT_543599 [Phascolomyces articulosus]|uniref:WW domain-containing protein n=1 Tax=Phascolomyces articulosus TaxID=60185 RepID=A0AAD5P7L7_9FUNG|nr:hypothetical protein BDA99DRAFT_543599 [Phascolomyces articulosus]